MKLSLYEQETILLYNQAEDTAEVYTHDRKLMEKLTRLSKKHPEHLPRVFLYRKTCRQKRKIPAHIIRAGIFLYGRNGDYSPRNLTAQPVRNSTPRRKAFSSRVNLGWWLGRLPSGPSKPAPMKQ